MNSRDRRCKVIKRAILFFILLILFVPQFTKAEGISQATHLKAAFVRDGDLWLYKNGQEIKFIDTGNVYATPSWSRDGQWILYQIETSSTDDEGQVQREIWVYNINSEKKTRIHHNGFMPQWAPNKNVIAFLDHEVLNISDLTSFSNVSLGVSDFTWLPDGNGFLLSSQSNLLPTGWTNPILYKVKRINKGLNKNAREFYRIPKKLGEGDQRIPAINASHLTFSPSNKWISLIVSPTASWSMDSNRLCVLSSTGEKFEVLADIIMGVGEPKWAPSEDMIALIAGGGRIVYGFKNKKLHVKEMPVTSPITPEDYAELDFTWVSNQRIITSRVKEKEWSNKFKEHPLPALYSINIEGNDQQKITNPPSGFGDYNPMSINGEKMYWYRGKSITDTNQDLWIADTNGAHAKKWLENVEAIAVFEKAPMN